MKTERYLNERKSLKDSPWGSLVGLVMLATTVSAIMRLFGAAEDQPLLTLYGVAAWKINWLFVSPAILIASNLIGWLFLWQRWRAFLLFAWAAFALNLLSYWAERLLVWSPDQNLQGNLIFMIIFFGVYLALMLLFTLDLKPKVRN